MRAFLHVNIIANIITNWRLTTYLPIIVLCEAIDSTLPADRLFDLFLVGLLLLHVGASAQLERSLDK